VGPGSLLLVALLFAAGAGLIVLAIRVSRWYVRWPLVPLAMVICSLAGMGVVNDYYGYYQTWGQLYSDLTGSYSRYTTNATGDRGPDAMVKGQVRHVTFAGALSGITRGGFVYLPPQYDQPEYAHTRFPVIELIHGSPGHPVDFIEHLNVAKLMNKMISDHELGPMIVVMPQSNAGRSFEECVNGPHVQDDTYVTVDVRRDVLAHFRASADPAEWGIAGYSSGGYCAANLALRHRDLFGAAGIIDGYFRPTDGPAAAALGFDPAAEAVNDPIVLASTLSRDAKPLPSFWVAAGSSVAADTAGAQAFAKSLRGVEQITYVNESGAGHNFYAWRPTMPHLLAWMWTQLAPPDLRVQFPVAGPVRSDVVRVPPMHRDLIPKTARRTQS
jgi:enterochelin esterase-like enzyme